MMKKYLLILFVLVAGLSSCKKDEDFDTVAQANTDDVVIQNYLKSHNITDYVKDPSGLYYQIVTPGTGAYPSGTSSITVNYTGTLVDGTQFDASTGFAASLNGGVIRGWTFGLQHINVGGTIQLFIPSGLAYGNNAQDKIPANSVLIFKIDLINIVK